MAAAAEMILEQDKMECDEESWEEGDDGEECEEVEEREGELSLTDSGYSGPESSPLSHEQR